MFLLFLKLVPLTALVAQAVLENEEDSHADHDEKDGDAKIKTAVQDELYVHCVDMVMHTL